MPNDTDTARDIAAGDAHTALRAALMPIIRGRPDADAIVSRVAAGDELALDYSPATRILGAALLGSRIEPLWQEPVYLPDDEATTDLYDVLGLALTAALNAEAPARRLAIAAAVEAGADFVCRLRVLAGTECLVLALAVDGRLIWKVERAAVFDRADRLRPEATLH